MIHVSRTALLIAVVLIALVILLMQRKEGATAAGSGCYRSLGEYDDNAGKYKTSGAGPPLDPKQCTGMEVGYGKDRKCYKSDGNKWKEQKGKSGKCVSWVKKVDWKASTNAKNRFPVYGSYKKSSGKWNATDSGLGEGLMSVTVEKCGAECDANTACTGFTFAKPKGGTKTFDCWLRNNANTNINKKDNTWYSYDKSGAAASGSSSGGDGNTVYLYETANFEVNQPFEVGEYPDLRTRNFNDKAQSMVIPNGYNVTVYEDINYSLGSATNIKAAATFGPGRHVLSDPEFIKSLTPDTASSYSVPNTKSGRGVTQSSRSINGWAKEISSMKVFKV
jgi:hypothetical protein